MYCGQVLDKKILEILSTGLNRQEKKQFRDRMSFEDLSEFERGFLKLLKDPKSGKLFSKPCTCSDSNLAPVEYDNLTEELVKTKGPWLQNHFMVESLSMIQKLYPFVSQYRYISQSDLAGFRESIEKDQFESVIKFFEDSMLQLLQQPVFLIKSDGRASGDDPQQSTSSAPSEDEGLSVGRFHWLHHIIEREEVFKSFFDDGVRKLLSNNAKQKRKFIRFFLETDSLRHLFKHHEKETVQNVVEWIGGYELVQSYIQQKKSLRSSEEEEEEVEEEIVMDYMEKHYMKALHDCDIKYLRFIFSSFQGSDRHFFQVFMKRNWMLHLVESRKYESLRSLFDFVTGPTCPSPSLLGLFQRCMRASQREVASSLMSSLPVPASTEDEVETDEEKLSEDEPVKRKRDILTIFRKMLCLGLDRNMKLGDGNRLLYHIIKQDYVDLFEVFSRTNREYESKESECEGEDEEDEETEQAEDLSSSSFDVLSPIGEHSPIYHAMKIGNVEMIRALLIACVKHHPGRNILLQQIPSSSSKKIAKQEQSEEKEDDKAKDETEQKPRSFLPVLECVRMNRVDILKEFLTFCPDRLQKCVNQEFQNALHLACIEHGNIEIIQELCSDQRRLKSYMNRRDVQGNTPLHYAMRFKRGEIAKYMIKLGGNTEILNQFGKSPANETLFGEEIVKKMKQENPKLFQKKDEDEETEGEDDDGDDRIKKKRRKKFRKVPKKINVPVYSKLLSKVKKIEEDHSVEVESLQREIYTLLYTVDDLRVKNELLMSRIEDNKESFNVEVHKFYENNQEWIEFDWKIPFNLIQTTEFLHHIESKKIEAHGHEWTMRFYPRGAETKKNSSVYLMLTTGNFTSYRYNISYSLTLVNAANPGHNIRYSSSNTYRRSEYSWGFANFATTRQLMNRKYGYLNKQHEILVRLRMEYFEVAKVRDVNVFKKKGISKLESQALKRDVI